MEIFLRIITNSSTKALLRYDRCLRKFFFPAALKNDYLHVGTIDIIRNRDRKKEENI